MVPKPSSNRLNIEKVNFHETSAGAVAGAFPGPQESTQNDPRSTQDGSKIILDRVFRLLIFRFDFESFSVPFWCRFGLPNGPPGARLNLGNRPWEGSKSVLRSSWFGSLVVLSFGVAFLAVLGSFWGALGVVWVLFRRFNSSIQPINSSSRRFNPSTHQPIDSTRQPINSSIPPINPSAHGFNPGIL